MQNRCSARALLTPICVGVALLTSGCMAQQADLKKTEQQLQSRIKQSNDELLQTRARQSQEISALREQELPQLRDQLDRAQHQAQDLQGKQDDLKQRSAVLEQQTRKLEQLAAKIETESTTRYSQVRESLNAQDVKNKQDRDQLRMDVNGRLDDVNRQMEVLRKDIIEAVQKANSGLAKSLDTRLEEQRKAAVESQARSEQLSTKFAQFNQSLTAFRESLTGLSERVGQGEQATKALTEKVDTDTRSSVAHVNDMNKAVTGHLGEVNKSVVSVAQKLAARLDEQDHRLDTLARTIDQVAQVAQDAHQRAGNKNGQRPAVTKPLQRSALPLASEQPDGEQNAATPFPAQPEVRQSIASAAAPDESDEAPRAHVSQPTERSDKLEYERLLALFREGNLDGARQGFVAFLRNYPNSDLSPNARYWLGESHYGKRDYKQAIDSYDRVEIDYPQSEKVPAAILKKGYAYLALKDRKRASSAFKQVVTLYPRSPEAGKASDKLSQLKETR